MEVHPNGTKFISRTIAVQHSSTLHSPDTFGEITGPNGAAMLRKEHEVIWNVTTGRIGECKPPENLPRA